MENSIPLSIFPHAPDKFCFCFCGLPGRGKTHIATRLGRYLDFFHAVPTKIVNTADYRRRMCGSLKDAEWFEPANAESKALRDYCNAAAIADAKTFLSQNANGVVIFDSTNVTHERRANLLEMVRATAICMRCRVAPLTPPPPDRSAPRAPRSCSSRSPTRTASSWTTSTAR